MGHWYRRPKWINLAPLIRHSSCEFVFDPVEISIEELSNFQYSFSGVIAPGRLGMGVEPSLYREQILVVPEGAGDVSPAARLREGWRGVIVVPRREADRHLTLSIFFFKQSRYRIVNHAGVVHSKAYIPPFLLDLTAKPALFVPEDSFPWPSDRARLPLELNHR